MVLGLVPALGLGGLYAAADARAMRNEPGATPDPVVVPALATPVISARRTPAALAGDATRQRYRETLAAVVSGIEGDGASCFAASLDGTPVFSAADQRLVVPASNMKLITGAVALEVLGADHPLTTSVKGVLDGSTVQGDLYFVGGGDATLSRADYPTTQQYGAADQPFTNLDTIADELAFTGVTRVTGRLVADESRYDDLRYNERWQAGIVADGEAGPLSALLVDDGKVAVEDRLPAADPAITAAEVFRSLLEDRGITIDGGVAVGVAPAGVPSLVERSISLADVSKEMLTTSDDNTAELLLKELGVHAGTGGSTEAGLEVVRQTLAGWGLATDDLVLVDGSGLSNANRVHCSTLLGVLDHMGATGTYFDSLPVAGRTGTLAEELAGTPFDGVLHAKTGSLDVAKALSGFVVRPDAAHTLAFSLIINGAPGNPKAVYELYWTALADALTSIPDRVSPDSLAPA